MADKQLLDDQPRLDRFAQTDVVRDEEIDTGHLDISYQRIELVVFDGDPAPERQLQKRAIRFGNGPPNERRRERLPGGHRCPSR